MNLRSRVNQIERRRGVGAEPDCLSVIYIREVGRSGGKDEFASASLLIGPQAGQQIIKATTETMEQFEGRVERLLFPQGRSNAERERTQTVTIGGEWNGEQSPLRGEKP
ncbi:hypothetical protein [Roseovarius sp.]|uniref:hypothetical protein n=1 Tax=Roseovarius sp. TaxID=1486281 RepID=UPI003A987A44